MTTTRDRPDHPFRWDRQERRRRRQRRRRLAAVAAGVSIVAAVGGVVGLVTRAGDDDGGRSRAVENYRLVYEVRRGATNIRREVTVVPPFHGSVVDSLDGRVRSERRTGDSWFATRLAGADWDATASALATPGGGVRVVADHEDLAPPTGRTSTFDGHDCSWATAEHAVISPSVDQPDRVEVCISAEDLVLGEDVVVGDVTTTVRAIDVDLDPGVVRVEHPLDGATTDGSTSMALGTEDADPLDESWTLGEVPAGFAPAARTAIIVPDVDGGTPTRAVSRSWVSGADVLVVTVEPPPPRETARFVERPGLTAHEIVLTTIDGSTVTLRGTLILAEMRRLSDLLRPVA